MGAGRRRTLSGVPRLAFDPIRRAAVLWERRWGRASAPQSMAAATSIMRVQQVLLADYDAALAPLDLTFARFECLVLLTFARDARLPMTTVGERLMIHPTSATHIVQRLASQGFVERVRNPADGRGMLAVLTPAGREAAEAGMAALVERGFGLGGLTGQERVELFRLLEKVRFTHGDFASLPAE